MQTLSEDGLYEALFTVALKKKKKKNNNDRGVLVM